MAKKRRKRKNGFYFDYSLLFVLIFIVRFRTYNDIQYSSYTAPINYGNPEYYFKRQLIFDLLGFYVYVFIARFVDYYILKEPLVDICYITFNWC